MNEPQKQPLEKRVIDKISAAKDKALLPHLVRENIPAEPDSVPFVELAERARHGIVRVTVTYKNGNASYGSGFFISPDIVFTCAHVLLNEDARALAEKFRRENRPDFKDAFENLLEGKEPCVELELFDGKKIVGEWMKIDCGQDVGMIKVPGKHASLPYLLRDQDELGEDVFFGGFQEIPYANPHEFPFTVNRGFISSVYETLIGGYKKRDHIQINAINLGGNSGGPLMLRSTGEVIGIINGNRMYGKDGVLCQFPSASGPRVEPSSIRVPVGIAYATSLQTAFTECNFVRDAIVPPNASDA